VDVSSPVREHQSHSILDVSFHSFEVISVTCVICIRIILSDHKGLFILRKCCNHLQQLAIIVCLVLKFCVELIFGIDCELVTRPVSGLVHLPDFLVKAPAITSVIVTFDVRVLVTLMEGGLPSMLISLHYIYLWAWFSRVLTGTVETVVSSIVKVA